MRPTLSWDDLRGSRVGVWGLGTEGAATIARLESMDIVPVLVDDRPIAGSELGTDVLATAEGGLESLEQCDVVVKTPGISRYRADTLELQARGIPVVGGLGLWLQGVDTTRVACITGTKGKSTTTTIAGHLLRKLGHRPMIGGNLGAPPWHPSLNPNDYDYWIIETSSYQATDLATSPPVVAVTSLFPDHLDWHGDVDTYYRDKLSACSQPGCRLTVANGDSTELRDREQALGARVDWVKASDEPGSRWTHNLQLLGEHNHRNALIAAAVLTGLGVPRVEDHARLAVAAQGFGGLDSRLQHIGDVGNVTFYDDSLSTNVLPTLTALAAFPSQRVALIAGGFDRGIDYQPLANGLHARPAATLVLTLPACGPRIRAAIEAIEEPTEVLHTEACDDLDEAVARAYAWAQPDGVVLLSPAAPSFGQFRDYRDRAAVFARAMHRLQHSEHDPMSVSREATRSD